MSFTLAVRLPNKDNVCAHKLSGSYRDYESLKVRKGLLLKEKEILQQNQNALQKQVCTM